MKEKQRLFNESNFGLVGLFNGLNFESVDYTYEKAE